MAVITVTSTQKKAYMNESDFMGEFHFCYVMRIRTAIFKSVAIYY